MSTDQARAEALQESKTITFRDLKLTIPPPDEWLLDYVHFTDRDQITLALEAMLGHSQYEAVRTLKPRPKMTEMNALIASAQSAFGMDPGNS